MKGQVTCAVGVAVVFALSGGAAFAGCNSGNVASTALLSSASCQASTVGDNTTAVGLGSLVKGRYSTGVGSFTGSFEGAEGFTAIGYRAGIGGVGKYSTAIGSGPSADGHTGAAGDYSIAIGGGDGTPFFDKFLVGARAHRFLSIALGTTSAADSDFAIALGFNARAGAGADIIGPIAIGPDAQATLTNAVALGRFSAATTEDTTAIGSASAASAASGLALGFGAKANKKNAVALGSRSVANVVNTVSVGRAGAERRIMNVAPGLLNTDAVNLAQVKALVSAAVAQAQGTVQAVAVAPAGSRPATRDADDAIRRELAELRSLVRQQRVLLEQQQERIARLEGSTAPIK